MSDTLVSSEFYSKKHWISYVNYILYSYIKIYVAENADVVQSTDSWEGWA